MDPEYVRRYRDLYERHWWWRAREHVIVDVLRQLRPVSGWEHILDVGCGGGVFFKRLAEFGGEGGDVEGVEPNAALVDAASPEARRIHLVPFDVRFQPGHSYGLILLLDVLEHLEAPVEALRHAASLLDRDGTIVITVPAFRALWTSHDDINEHHTRYTKRTMGELADAAGVELQRLHYFFHWTAPAKLVQRGAERILRPSPRPAAVPPTPVNRALYALSRLEFRLMRGLPIPFGSSLLAIGRRAR